MKKANKWLIIATILMILSFIISGFFFLKSGLLDLETGKANEEVVFDLQVLNIKLSAILHIPLSDEAKEIQKRIEYNKTQS